MTDTKTNEEKPIPVIQQDDGTAIIKHLPEDIEHKEEETRGDRRQGRDPDDEDDGGQDTSGAGGNTETSRNRRRRQRAREARQQREGDIQTLSTVVESQQRMIAALTRGQQQQALITLEGEARQCQEAYAEAKRRHAEAITAGDGAKAGEAQTVMNNSNNYYQNLVGQHNAIKAHIEKSKEVTGDEDDAGGAPSRQGSGNGRPRLSARQVKELTTRKEAFLDAHPEVDPDTDDDIQAAIKAIDTKVERDGFEPWTDDYWDELSERLQKAGLVRKKKTVDRNRRDDLDDDEALDRLRDTTRRQRRAADDDDERGGPPVGGAGRGNGSGVGETRLSAEMVKALEDANIPLAGGTPETIRRRNNILRQWQGGPPSRQQR